MTASTPLQRSFVLLKPDTVRRGLIGAVLSRFESKGLKVVALELRQVDGELADQHYAEHLERDFYPPLREFVTSGPSIAMIVEGDEAIEVVRALNGATDGRKAAPGTIRGDFSLSNRENLVHGSDSPESAAREIALWFPERCGEGGLDLMSGLAGLLRASEGTGVGHDLPTRSLIFDLILAGVFFACGSVFLPLFFQEYRPIDALFVGLVTLPLMLRRRLPRVSFLLCQGFGLAQVWWPSPIGLHDGGLLFSLYSLVGFTNRRIGLYGLLILGVVAFSGAINDWWGFVDDQLNKHDPGLLTRIATTAGMLGLVFAAWASGERLRSARMGQVALADRADQLERERAQQSRIAAAAERARIAREMHDVIAHALSVMIAQADGAAYVIDSSPEAAKTALQRISGTGRESLTQMRGLLGLLRGSDDDHDPTSVPQPGLEQVPQLLEEAGSTGLRVSLEQHGTIDQVAEMVGLTIYRLLQESLTNARKHGGDEVRVQIDAEADGVRLSVINSVAEASKQLQTAEPGHGLQGMRERVSAVGGRVSAGQQPDGFEVRAWLPHLPATVSGADPASGGEDSDDDQGVPGR